MFRNGDIDTALAYADHAISLGADVQNLRMKARILEKKGDVEGAKALRARSDALAPENAVVSRANDLIGGKKYDEAASVLNKEIASNPKSWRAWTALGDMYGAKGDMAKAKESFDKAMALATDQSERVEVQDSINSLAADVK
jgi:tetratricopeptide (TPR) repeat protein